MKRIIAAASLALLAGPAFSVEIGKPYEQLDVDRALPNITQRAPSDVVYPFGGSAPYEQLAVDRTLPNIPENRTQFAASGATRSDTEIGTDERAASVWADNHNFVAPAQ